jgi:NPCBM/NEW2 domain
MRFCRVPIALLVLAGVATFSAGDDLRTLSDKVISGELISIDDKTMTLKGPDGPVAVSLDKEVLELSLQAPPAAKDMPHCDQVELIDGSLLYTRPVEKGGFVIKQNKVTLTLLNDQKVDLALTALSYVLRNANDAKFRDPDQSLQLAAKDWKRIVKERATRDLVAVWDKERIRINGVEGTFAENGDGTILAFTIASSGTVREKNDLTGKNTQGWVFVNKPDAGAPVAKCRLLDMHYNNLAVAKVTVKEGGAFQVVTVSGLKLEYPKAQVARLDFRKGRLEFLSDIRPDKIAMEPAEDRPDRYRYYEDAGKRNKNLDGSQLKLGDKKFDHGLSLPAPTTIQYLLKTGDNDDGFKEFSATIGVDESVPGGSHAKLIVKGDGRELFSGDVKRKDPPREIRLNIKDIRMLTIEVVPAGVLPYGHRVDLGDVKVNK